jgi:hypothetical protein
MELPDHRQNPQDGVRTALADTAVASVEMSETSV